MFFVPKIIETFDYMQTVEGFLKDPSTVFLFSENLECLVKGIEVGLEQGTECVPGMPNARTACVPGMPNALPKPTCLRDMPNASPIPTGFRKGGGFKWEGFKWEGFKLLDQRVSFNDETFIVKDLIDACFEGLRMKIMNNPKKFRKVVYSADADGRWSCRIFIVGDEVLDYITKKIEELNNDKEFLDCFLQTSDIRKMDNFDSFFSRAP